MEFLTVAGHSSFRPVTGRARAVVAACAIAAAATGCNAASEAAGKSVEIQRTAHGIAHIKAPDYESLAYGIAYAHAGDNLCQTANHLVTIRGERSRFFGADEVSLLGLRPFPNEQIDIFIRAHMDDAALARAAKAVSPEAQAMARGYVAGYNRFLEDRSDELPEPCGAETWVRPMTAADYLRLQELTMVQLGVALMADAMIAAAPPGEEDPVEQAPVQEAANALERFRIENLELGSNGWAFGSEVTANARGVLLGNPHFPWAGVNRFWEMHLTIPGRLDVMGAAIGHSPVVQIGFNKDVAWTHTVSTGKRFTLFELELASGEPTRYMLDGESVPMQAETVSYEVRTERGEIVTKEHTIWNTRFGPIIEAPSAGLNWSADRAYALQDANTLNMRAMDIWVGFNRAEDVNEMVEILGRLGVPWVNTMATDRHGNVLYADVSVVPDVDAAQLQRCAPSEPAAALFDAAGLVVLDGSTADCDWHRDPESPVPGFIPMERMPVAVRQDWVQNSNDSFWLSNPDIDWPEFSPLIGATHEQQSLRTRAGLYAIRERLAGEDGIAEHGKIGLPELQAMLFQDRNHAAFLVLDDLLAACEDAETTAVTEGCAVLAEWDRHNNLESRGAHLFREWWRAAHNVENVWREPFDPQRPATTPSGLQVDDDEVRSQLLTMLENAVVTVRSAGFEPDAPLGDVQVHSTNGGTVGLHGGTEAEGLLNKLEMLGTETLLPGGYQVNFGSSYIQTVTFDDEGPVAEAIMTYGQSSNPASKLAFDQLSLFAAKEWMTLPFHPDEVAKARVGEVLRLAVE